MRLRPVAWLWLACVACASSGVASAQAPDAALISALEQQVATVNAHGTSEIRQVAIAWPAVIQDFYQRRQFQPAWPQAAKITQFMQVLDQSRDEGLDPADFNQHALAELQTALSAGNANPQLKAEFDVLLTDSLTRLVYQLAFGKVDPTPFVPQWNFARMIDGLDPAGVMTRIIDSPSLATSLESIRPENRLYQGLMRELVHYRELESKGGWSPLASGPSMKPGASDARVPALRQRAIAEGDLPAESASPSLVYDEALAGAVKRFQTRVGLSPDGVVGGATLTELNVPVAQRIDTLRVNLDRGRVLLHDLPQRFVVVNVAGFWVYLYDNGEIIWRARAQVGKPYRATPIFRSEISYLVFNPTWTVPPGIIAGDILPAARKDPAAITRKGLDVLDRNGQVIAPESVNWSSFKSGHIPYTLVQQPGPNNSLGLVKFMFPNSYSVYLHDTPSKSRFESDARAFSSGCVRVERPFELAEQLLAEPEKWNPESIQRVIAGGKTTNVTLAKKVPVLLTYWTAWVDKANQLSFRPDVYQQDAPWLAQLRQPMVVRRVAPASANRSQ
jgi:L,D-transpeptidase YcbB